MNSRPASRTSPGCQSSSVGTWTQRLRYATTRPSKRKAKARAEKDKVAEANRVAHGTPKVLRNLAKARKDKAEKDLSGHALENETGDN